MAEEFTIRTKVTAWLILLFVVWVIYMVASAPSTPDPDALNACVQIRTAHGEGWFRATELCTIELGQ